MKVLESNVYIFMLNKYVEGGSHTYTVQTHTFHRQHINNNPRVSLRSGVAVSFVLFAFYVGFIFVCFDNESIIDKCASDNSHFAVLVLLRCATVWYSSHFESTASVFYYVAPISHHVCGTIGWHQIYATFSKKQNNNLNPWWLLITNTLSVSHLDEHLEVRAKLRPKCDFYMRILMRIKCFFYFHYETKNKMKKQNKFPVQKLLESL